MSGILAYGEAAVVAAHAVVGDSEVVEGRRGESVRRVTFLAVVIGWNVPGRFPDCRGAVMATDAVVDDSGMAEGRRRRESRCCVTRFAVIS